MGCVVFRLNWYWVVWIRWNAWLLTKAGSLHQALEQRAGHGWGDVILMLDDALEDRDHDAETAWYCDVGGVSQGDIPVRIVGGPRGAARQLGLTAMQCRVLCRSAAQ
jgi:hypothetical protein